MAPTAVLELPDVMTNGCDEGVEFAFLDDEPGDNGTAEEDETLGSVGAEK
jgi:hypothetical protein